MSTIAGTLNVSVNISDKIQEGSLTAISGTYSHMVAYTVPVIQQVVTTFTNGAGANQVSRAFAAKITTSSATSIDLTSVFCTDLTQGFSNVRLILAWNTDANSAHVLKFGDDAVGTNLFLGGLKGTHPQFSIPASSCYVDYDPLDPAGWVVDATHKNLRFDPGGVAITFRVVVLGN